MRSAETCLGAALEPLRRGYKAPLDGLPEDVRERLESEGLADEAFVDFTYPPAPRCRAIQRSHPLVSVLAETLLERTLAAIPEDEAAEPGVLGRVGCWVAAGLDVRTVVALVRLRHQLSTQRAGTTTTTLVEEAYSTINSMVSPLPAVADGRSAAGTPSVKSAARDVAGQRVSSPSRRRSHSARGPCRPGLSWKRTGPFRRPRRIDSM